MKNVQKAIAMLLAVMLLASLAACNNSADTDSSKQPDDSGTAAPAGNSQGVVDNPVIDANELLGHQSDKEVIIAIGNDPTTLCPYSDSGGEHNNLTLAILYQLLIAVDIHGNYEYVLAKSMTEVEPGTYEFELYDYIYDTAGNHMTAEDVIFSYDLASVRGTAIDDIKAMESYEAVDEYKVRITFKDEKLGELEAVLNVPIITKAGWEQSADEMAHNVIGTSPYTLVNYENGAYYTYERTDNYWQKDESLIGVAQLSNPKRITLRVITDKATAAVSLESGEITAANSLSSVDYVNFMDEKGDALDGYTVVKSPNNVISYFLFNMSDESPCRDINFRKAVCYAIDTNAIAQNVFGIYGNACYNLTNPGWMDSDDALNTGDYFQYDEELARQYLAQSDYAGEKIKILVLPEETMRSTATFCQAYLNAIGIECECINLEGPSWVAVFESMDPTQYDLNLFMNASNFYSWKVWQRFSADFYTNGLNGDFIRDETLEDLYHDAGNPEYGTTGEGVNKFVDYMNENVYAYAFWYYNNVFIARDEISAFGISRSDCIYPGSCVFAE